jgi:hypothetical protein
VRSLAVGFCEQLGNGVPSWDVEFYSAARSGATATVASWDGRIYSHPMVAVGALSENFTIP